MERKIRFRPEITKLFSKGHWGWVIVGCAFAVHLSTYGLQFSYGLLLVEILNFFHHFSPSSSSSSSSGLEGKISSNGLFESVIAAASSQSTKAATGVHYERLSSVPHLALGKSSTDFYGAILRDKNLTNVGK